MFTTVPSDSELRESDLQEKQAHCLALSWQKRWQSGVKGEVKSEQRQFSIATTHFCMRTRRVSHVTVASRSPVPDWHNTSLPRSSLLNSPLSLCTVSAHTAQHPALSSCVSPLADLALSHSSRSPRPLSSPPPLSHKTASVRALPSSPPPPPLLRPPLPHHVLLIAKLLHYHQRDPHPRTLLLLLPCHHATNPAATSLAAGAGVSSAAPSARGRFRERTGTSTGMWPRLKQNRPPLFLAAAHRVSARRAPARSTAFSEPGMRLIPQFERGGCLYRCLQSLHEDGSSPCSVLVAV
eukprot:1577793-Rhodomonas_salina.2